MTEHIHAVNITHSADALAWLQEPTPCLDCDGDGKQVQSGWTEDGVFFATISRCSGCLGTGFAAWFSWNWPLSRLSRRYRPISLTYRDIAPNRALFRLEPRQPVEALGSGAHKPLNPAEEVSPMSDRGVRVIRSPGGLYSTKGGGR